MIPAFSYADLNVLILGSNRDSSDQYFISGSSSAFAPDGVKAQLENILKEDPSFSEMDVNVVFEDIFQTTSYVYNASNLISWFHFPYPAGVETDSRWPNLRGEAGTEWDYIILIGDPYTMETMPGLYTHGVAKITEEVAKSASPAEVVLLMPWPAEGSASTVEHYREVVYRTGRSGGFKVAPAGLAWVAANSPRSPEEVIYYPGDGSERVEGVHPSAEGAYIAAASLYSRIWNKNAKVSNYVYDDDLADIAYSSVNDNIGAQQYTGSFEFQSPFKFFHDKSRNVRIRKAGGGSSTEENLVLVTSDAFRRINVNPESGISYRIGRDAGGPSNSKDYRLGGHSNAFGYYYHTEGNNADAALANIVYRELDMADRMIDEDDTYRLSPRRILLGGLIQFDPDMGIVSGGHIYGPQAHSMGSYMATMISGRCTVDPEPEIIDNVWHAHKTGYEMAWRVGTLQVRAPGFKTIPSRTTVPKLFSESLIVEFINQPRSNVTVSISSDSDDVTVSPQTLTFTPENYNIRQAFAIQAKSSAQVGDSLSVSVSTVSDDEVYHALSDVWTYEINQSPAANTQAVVATSEIPLPITLTGSDADGESLSFIIENQPDYGTVVIDGPVAVYTSGMGYTGLDSFTFRASDGGDESASATVNLSVIATERYDFNLLSNPGAELSPLTDYQWVVADGGWEQGDRAQEGSWSFDPTTRSAEIYQDVDLNAYGKAISSGLQEFTFSGYAYTSNDEPRVILEFRDASQTVLASHDSGTIGTDGNTWVSYAATYEAPINATVARIRLISENDKGSSNGALHDVLSFSAVKPPSNYTVWANDAEFDHDSNQDGIADGIAWVLGASDPSSDVMSKLPKLADSIDSLGYIKFTYHRSDIAHTDAVTSISVEYSSDLTDWATVVHDDDNMIITELDDFYGTGVDKVEIKLKETLTNGKRVFIRLKAAQ